MKASCVARSLALATLATHRASLRAEGKKGARAGCLHAVGNVIFFSTITLVQSLPTEFTGKLVYFWGVREEGFMRQRGTVSPTTFSSKNVQNRLNWEFKKIEWI